MNEQEAKDDIASSVSVSRQDVVLGKSYILSHFNASSKKMLRRFLEHVDVDTSQPFTVHESVPPGPQIRQAAMALRWQMAFGEAIWGLIGAGLILPQAGHLELLEAQQSWTTRVAGSGGGSGSWRFKEFDVAMPTFLRLAPSSLNADKLALSDADLFLSELDIPNLTADVEDALTQAVECFRHDLYLPCVAMLGMASEGAWIELGSSLLRANPENLALTAAARGKRREKLGSHYTSVREKIELVIELYERQDVYGNVAKKNGYKPRSLKEAFIWSNVVRDSRNAIHYGSEAATRNNYEKVAVLLLGASQCLRIIYSIKNAADEVS